MKSSNLEGVGGCRSVVDNGNIIYKAEDVNKKVPRN